VVRLQEVRVWLAASVGLGLILTGCVAVQAVLLGDVLARLLHPPANLHSIVSELVGLVAVTALRSVVLAASAPAGQVAANRVRGRLRRDGLAAVLERGPAWLAGERSGELAVTLGTGLERLDAYVGDYLPRLVLAVLAPVVLLGVIGDLDWLSLIVVLVALALVPVFMILIGRLTEERVARRWLALTALGSHFLDTVEGLATLRAYGRAHRQEDQIAEVTDEVRRTTLSVLREAFLSALVLETLAALGTALVAVPLAIRLIDGHVTLAPALSVLVLTPEVFLPLRRASADFHASAEGLSATDRVMDILEPAAKSNVQEAEPHANESVGKTERTADAPAASGAMAGGLRLRGVRVAYPGRPGDVLCGIDLDIKPGERVAIVGPSGAGKSTLLGAVLGLVPLSGGSIALGDRSQAETGADAWMESFASVPQSPHLFTGNLEQNLYLGSSATPSSRGASLEHALEVARLVPVLDGLPGGLKGDLGEAGERLSAGERQRVAIARALLRSEARVVVFDEPSAHLDTATEAELADRLEEALAGRTLLVVTHRRRILELADRMVTITGGRIVAVAAGPHALAMRRGSGGRTVASAPGAGSAGVVSAAPTASARGAAPTGVRQSTVQP